MKTVSVGELKSNFSEILKDIQSSEEEYVIQYGKKKNKVAILSPYPRDNSKLKKRKFGILKGKGGFKIKDDFKMTEEELLGL